MEEYLEDFFIEAATKEGFHYEPKDESETEYEAFLEIIENLQKLQSIGLIEILDIHKSSRTGKFDKILYRIKTEGREWISENTSSI